MGLLSNKYAIIITGIGSLSPLLGVKIVHLVDRSDWFKISNLVFESVQQLIGTDSLW